jgi:hypothetical protein
MIEVLADKVLIKVWVGSGNSWPENKSLQQIDQTVGFHWRLKALVF